MLVVHRIHCLDFDLPYLYLSAGAFSTNADMNVKTFLWVMLSLLSLNHIKCAMTSNIISKTKHLFSNVYIYNF